MNHKLGPIFLAEGISRMNVITFFYSCFICIGLLAGMNFVQGYILTVVLDVPMTGQGTITGNLAFAQEIIAIALIGPFGILCDRIGRKPVFVFGTVLISLGFAIYPYASTLTELFMFRIFFAIGAASLSCVLAVVTGDYPAERSRGKFVSAHSVLNAFGVLGFAVILGILPKTLEGSGFEPIEAAKLTMLLAAVIGLISAWVFYKGLKGGTPNEDSSIKTEKPGTKELVNVGLKSMKNPRIALSFAATFLARADVSVNGLFISQWAITSGFAMGLTPSESMLKVVPVIVTTNLISVFWAFIFGWIIDRINRVAAMTIAMGMGMIAYSLIITVDSPLDMSNLPVFILISCSAIGTVVATASLIGQEAPIRERGTVIGFSSFFGAIGILIATAVGGRLFDLSPAGPFLLIASVNAILFIASVLILIKAPGKNFKEEQATLQQ
jgi:MFS family permease